MNGHGHNIFGTSDTDMNRVITSDADTGSDTHMSENIGHGFGLGHDFGYDFGHAESELHGMNVAKINDQF